LGRSVTRAKAAGTYDPLAEHARHLQAQIARCRANGVDPAPIIEVQSHLGELLAQASQRQQPAPNSAMTPVSRQNVL